TPLSDSNKDGCLAPKDDIEVLLHHDPSTPLKSVASILEGFINDPPFKENENLFDLECKTNDWKRILYDAPIDEAECFDLGGDKDEIDAFLAIKVPTDDTTYNLSPDVFFDHEPQHIENESDHVTFYPKSDPLHHEFTGELITIPPRIVREHEDYINRMSLLCGNLSSQSPNNSHTIIESLLTSTTLVEDSDSHREEINIFFGPDDSIPPGIESDFNPEKDIIDNLLNDDPIFEYERLTFDMEPDVPVINNTDVLNEEKCFDPGRFLPYLPPLKMRTPFLTPASPLRAGGISSGWNFHGRQNRGQGNNAWAASAAGYGGAQNRVGNANLEYFKDKMLLMQAQENVVALDEEQLIFIAGRQDNAADDCDAFDSDVDEAPTTQTMFMANLSSAYPVYDEASPSYDSDILSEVPDHDNYQDAVCKHHEVHEMHDDVQPNYVVDSHADYTSDSNMIPYDQYVKDNIVPVVQSNVYSVPNDAYMMI
ncbi:hypothetical protein Tco_1392940, partial [Tanacetum coccineum]